MSHITLCRADVISHVVRRVPHVASTRSVTGQRLAVYVCDVAPRLVVSSGRTCSSNTSLASVTTVSRVVIRDDDYKYYDLLTCWLKSSANSKYRSYKIIAFIYHRPLTDINVIASICVLNLRIKF